MTVSDGFKYKKKALHCEGVDLSAIAARAGTPAWVYSASSIRLRARALLGAVRGGNVHFAMKACSNLHILKLLAREGCGADIVSGGELFRASIAGISPSKIVFSGVGKTDDEIRLAISAGVGCFNVESPGELARIGSIAKGTRAPVRVAFRVNPDIDAKTHPHISTGLDRNKFGLSPQELAECYALLPRYHNVRAQGLSCHIGSQILSTKPLIQAWKKLRILAEQAPFGVTHLDLGGGLGISYDQKPAPTIASYKAAIREVFAGTKYKLSIEPGRALTGPCAVLLTSLTNIKTRGKKSFFVVDAAMNDLMRPALYGATHRFLPIRESKLAQERVDIVGPVCESGDTFEVGAHVPRSEPGELFIFSNAGAYGMSMSSQYNARPRAPEILVNGNRWKIIRERETYADLIAHELI